jgi:WD40 repeat protein
MVIGYISKAVIIREQLDQGAYGIIDNNHLVYVQNGGQLSSIVIKDLGTMNDLVYPVNGNLWGTEPVKIPNTNKFLNFTDPNKAIDFNYKLVTADIVTQKVDTILKNFYGDVEEYTINPHNNNIYLLTVSNHYDIIEYNPATEKFSIFLGNVNYIRNLKFFPNNNNYAYIRKDQNGYYNIFLNINGIEKQLTKYPGDVTGFSISPDGNFIAFSANRRDEIQSWVISIN